MALVCAAGPAIRRHAMVIGTAKNSSGWADIADGVRKEIESAEKLLLNELRYERDTFLCIVDAPKSELTKQIALWVMNTALTVDDWLLVYYTGHGIERPDGLRLVTCDVEHALPQTALAATDVVSALLGAEQVPAHVLLVLDTCHSGAGHLDVEAAATRIRESGGGKGRASDFHVIATTRSVGDAVVGDFIEAVSTVLRQGSAARSEEQHVQPGALLEHVNRLLALKGGQRASYSGGGETALRFLPNPNWLPRLRPNMSPDERALVLFRIQDHAARSHWIPRSRGLSTRENSGWYFTGRENAIRRLIKGLSNAGVARGAAVTGGPGSGKSAVLARLVTIADTEQRTLALAAGALRGVAAEALPPVGLVDLAIHARAKDASMIALEIAAALDLDISDAADAELGTLNALSQRNDPLAIVIDALDEADRPADVAAFVRSAMERATCVRSVVGVRATEASSLIELLGPFFERVDLDAPQWTEHGDIAKYVQRYLESAPESPYLNVDAALVAATATAVADRAGKSFLVASTTAHALAARGTVMKLESLIPLPATVGEALALDLGRFKGTAGQQLRDILTALAYGEGRGLPKEEWCTLANAISGGSVLLVDIDRWLKEASFYITTEDEFGKPVHRLYHEEFARHLRAVAPAACEEKVVDSLLQGVKVPRMGITPAWNSASPYMLAYYCKHLLRLGRLAALTDLACSQAWIAAKRERFGDLGSVFGDLELVFELAKPGEPADLDAILRACVAYKRFAVTAPPIVIDVIAAKGELERARLMADAIDFPLDRCQAFSLLARRYADEDDQGRALKCAKTANSAARAIRGHYQTLAFFWVIQAAEAAHWGQTAEWIRLQIRRALDRLPDSLPWGRDERADLEFVLPHWLFWAAKCLQAVEDQEGLSLTAKALRPRDVRPINLVLQTAAIAGDREFLSTLRPEGLIRRGNLALAFVEAGLVEEFERIRVAKELVALDGSPDAMKRYAWALAMRGDFQAALETSSAVKDREESARALFRIAETAAKTGDRRILTLVGDAIENASRVGHDAADSEQWRVQSWHAAGLLRTGRVDKACAIAERVCQKGIVPSLATSLATAVPSTARSKGHVQVEIDPDAESGIFSKVLNRLFDEGMIAALAYLTSLEPSPRARALSLLGLAKSEKDAGAAYATWVKALIASRFAGAEVFNDVVVQGEALCSRVWPNQTWSIVARVKQLEAESAGTRLQYAESESSGSHS